MKPVSETTKNTLDQVKKLGNQGKIIVTEKTKMRGQIIARK